MNLILGAILFLIFLFLSSIHIYWGLGGKWGAVASIPTKLSKQKIMNPGLGACLVVATGLLIFGVFILIKAGIILFALPAWLTGYGLWGIAIIFLLRAIGDFRYVGLFKKVKTTRFGQMDTKYFTPLCLLLGLLIIALQVIT